MTFIVCLSPACGYVTSPNIFFGILFSSTLNHFSIKRDTTCHHTKTKCRVTLKWRIGGKKIIILRRMVASNIRKFELFYVFNGLAYSCASTAPYASIQHRDKLTFIHVCGYCALYSVHKIRTCTYICYIYSYTKLFTID